VAAGRRRSPATLPGFHAGRAPSVWPGTTRARSSTWLTWSSAAVTQQLACLRHFYEADRILVLQFERCRRDTLAQYRRRVEFLGVRDRGFAPRRVRRRVGGQTRARSPWPRCSSSDCCRNQVAGDGQADRRAARRASGRAAVAGSLGGAAHRARPRRDDAVCPGARVRRLVMAELRTLGSDRSRLLARRAPGCRATARWHSCHRRPASERRAANALQNGVFSAVHGPRRV
jgi:hypothetical protein